MIRVYMCCIFVNWPVVYFGSECPLAQADDNMPRWYEVHVLPAVGWDAHSPLCVTCHRGSCTRSDWLWKPTKHIPSLPPGALFYISNPNRYWLRSQSVQDRISHKMNLARAYEYLLSSTRSLHFILLTKIKQHASFAQTGTWMQIRSWITLHCMSPVPTLTA